MTKMYDVQIALEKRMMSQGVTRWTERSAGTAEDLSNWDNKLNRVFIEPVSQAIDLYLQETSKGRTSEVVKHLKLIPSTTSAYLLIRESLSMLALHNTVSVKVLARQIGGKIEDEARFSLLRGDNEDAFYWVDERLKEHNSKSYKHRKKVYAHTAKKLREDWDNWGIGLKTRLGYILIKLLCMFAEKEGDPLFSMGLENIGDKRSPRTTRVITVTGTHATYVSEFIEKTCSLFPLTGPCVIPPQDWTTPFRGGFHSTSMMEINPLLKVKDRKFAALQTRSKMPLVYKAVNGLQRTSWGINSPILRILELVVKQGKGLAIPSLLPSPAPLFPFSSDKVLQDLQGKELINQLSSDQLDQFTQWKKDKKIWHEREMARVSNLLKLGGILRVAKQYDQYKELFFVYACDYRCRVNVRTTGISPHGGDLEKGLLRFSMPKKPIGNVGGFWFKSQGAKLWGLGNQLFSARVAAMEEPSFMRMCRAIADDPMHDKSWTGADKPWQFLAWCLEYARLMSWVKGGEKEEDFITFVAPAQDGKCSGLQHYSAMLRDEITGRSVNLMDTGVIQDVYNDVATLTLSRIKTAAAVFTDFAEGWLKVGVDREICKISVMTLTYASMIITCRRSISKYMEKKAEKERGEAKAADKVPVPVHPFGDQLNKAEMYLSNVMWPSIGEKVKRPIEAMKFLQTIARLSAKRNEALIWDNFVGFSIKQEVFETKAYTLNTCFHGRVQFQMYETTEELSVRKMVSKIAANFVHGCDSSHLILSICHMLDRGITQFWVIHDDFATYCFFTYQLRDSLRITFCTMYQENALENFWLDVCNNQGYWYDVEEQIPEQGSLDLSLILHSPYAFS